MRVKAVSGIMLTLLLIGILFVSVSPLASSVQHKVNSHYFAVYSGHACIFRCYVDSARARSYLDLNVAP